MWGQGRTKHDWSGSQRIPSGRRTYTNAVHINFVILIPLYSCQPCGSRPFNPPSLFYNGRSSHIYWMTIITGHWVIVEKKHKIIPLNRKVIGHLKILHLWNIAKKCCRRTAAEHVELSERQWYKNQILGPVSYSNSSFAFPNFVCLSGQPLDADVICRCSLDLANAYGRLLLRLENEGIMNDDNTS